MRDLTGGRGADAVYQVTGRAETFDLAFTLTRFHGRVVSLGGPRWPAPVDMYQMHAKALCIYSAQVGSHPPEPERQDRPPAHRWSQRANAALAMELLAQRRLNVRDLITHRVPAAAAPALYTQLLARREEFLGVILDWAQA